MCICTTVIKLLEMWKFEMMKREREREESIILIDIYNIIQVLLPGTSTSTSIGILEYCNFYQRG
jgi:hypothetical protein